MPLDAIRRAWFELRLKHVYADSQGNDFQRFFSRLMTLRYPEDFVATTTWGATGDLKNDGYLRTTRQLFGVYAPREVSMVKTKAKVTKDYSGAVQQWSDHFDEWVLVHNSREGLPAPLLKHLLDLEKTHKKAAKEWGFDLIRMRVFQLGSALLVDLFGGDAPSPQEYFRLSFEEIRDVLAAIAESPVDTTVPIRPVPPGKAEKVNLSPAARTYLDLGMKGTDRVASYLRNHVDPLKGERIANSFRERYRQLESSGLDPDSIILELRDFACGAGSTASHEAAGWAVLAYLFERCDIFTIEEMQTVTT